MIGIIDYSMGNLRSVQKAFERLGTDAAVISSPREIGAADKLVLPGVGAFADGAEHLRRAGLDEAIIGFIDSGRPFLGVCVGMQLLFDCSQEDEPNRGLAVLGGPVVGFEARGRLKVPHMGWNTIAWQRDDPLLAGLEQDSAVYFVHGYYPRPADESVVSARCDYGGSFCASVWRDNVWATQFHPEKSQRIGLRMLENFARL